MSRLAKQLNALPARAIEAYYRRMASKNGAGFQAHPDDVARGLVGPDLLPPAFQGPQVRLAKAPRRKS